MSGIWYNTVMKLIPISGHKYPNVFTKVDDDDYQKLTSMGTWLLCKGSRKNSLPYVMRFDTKKYKWVMMHRVVMKAKKGQFIDHKNGDSLDNQKNNLRFCTSQQNQYNQHLDRKSKHLRGVSFIPRDSKRNPWRAQIGINGKTTRIGNYSSEEEAHLAYNKALLKIAGEFANLR